MLPIPQIRRARSIASIALLLVIVSACHKKSHRNERAQHKAKPETPESASALPQIGILPGQGCPTFLSGRKRGRVQSTALKEASGLVSSRKNRGVLWSHNDSGGNPNLFAFTETGVPLGTYHLKGVTPVDWEDLATGPAPSAGDYYLYIADTGTNVTPRERVSVYRVIEPLVDGEQSPRKHRIRDVERFDFVYEDGAVHDAETLMVDPLSDDVYVVTKPRDGSPKAYLGKAPLNRTEVNRLTEIATLSSFTVGSPRASWVTAGDISPDGSLILVRSYTVAYLYRREPAQSIRVALNRPPCRVPLSLEPQGETIAFAPSGNAYFTVSEGHDPKVFEFVRAPRESNNAIAPTPSGFVGAP